MNISKKVHTIMNMCIQVGLSAYIRCVTCRTAYMRKRSKIVDSGFVQTCDELFKVKNLDVKCGSCVSSFRGGQNGGQNGGGQIISPCISCKNLTCANCQDYCDNCSIFVCGQCSIQSPLNCYSRRCLYC